MKQKNYKKRIIDELIDERIEVFGALNIVGPKGCGKTETERLEELAVALRKKGKI